VRRVAIAVLSLCAVMARADCSAGFVPNQFAVAFHGPPCNAGAPCVEKTPVHFSIGPPTGTCYIPLYGPCKWVPYPIDACDTLTWDFGDGTLPVVVRGSGDVEHVFDRPGNYDFTIGVRNAVGRGTIYGSTYICAGPPVFLRFASKIYEVAEDAGSVAVTLERSGDVSSAFAIQYESLAGSGKIEPLSMTVSFAAGETTRTIVQRVIDDGAFTGDRDDYVGIRSDGAAVTESGSTAVANVRVLEDEPGPRLTIDDVTAPEGDGEHVIDVPLHLTMPASDRVYLNCTPRDGTAHEGVDFRLVDYSVIFEPGQSSAACRMRILGNRFAEPDKTFTVSADPVLGPVSVKRRTALCTLINDDTGVARRRAAR
jgi:hypothetical protein